MHPVLTPDQTVTEALRVTSGFIHPDHLTADTLADLGDWYRARPARPKVYRNFLRPAIADGVARALRALPVWDRCATVFQGPLTTGEIPEAEWPDHPDRAACHFIARPLVSALDPGGMDATLQHVLQQFLAFAVLAGPLRTWIGAGIGQQLERRTSVELACYRRGDAISAHQDLYPRRVLAVNFYLDEDYRPGTGGRLGFRNGDGTEFHVDPLFNTFSLIPILPDCHHWVEPFAGEGIGRFTISIGQHRGG
jgi:hypothetical protein